MDTAFITDSFDLWTENALNWINDQGGWFFGLVRAALDGLYGHILGLLNLPPFYITALIVAVLGWRLINLLSGCLLGAALVLCAAMGLWSETLSTLALVTTATFLALLVGIPIGIVAGFNQGLDQGLEPVLDLIQTLPPYIYLLPAIALLGYGPATALVATFIVAMPPAIQ